MSIPHHFDPMGTAAAVLPPGYERVESVLKPQRCWWKTNIPAASGFRVEADITPVEKAPDGGFELRFLICNVQPTNNRIYYIFATGSEIYAPSRYSTINTSIKVNYGSRQLVVCEHSDTAVTFKKEGVNEFHRTGLQPIDRGVNFDLGISTQYESYAGGIVRIFDIKWYRAGTDDLVAHYVPVRVKTADGYRYGLYDLVAHAELVYGGGEAEA